jgi:hypothetical protein
MVPDPRLRLSDAERERFVEQLHSAVGEGRLTLDEFEERVGKILAASTYEAALPYLADLPAAETAPREVELRARSSGMKRLGRWRVPRRLLLDTQSASVKLDFTESVLDSRVVDIQLDARSSSITLVMPPDGSVDITNVDMFSSSSRVKVGLEPGAGLHVRVNGRLKSSGLTVRHRRRFLRWHW